MERTRRLSGWKRNRNYLPLVTPELLEQMRLDHPRAVEAGLAAFAAGLPVGTRYWQISRNLDWFGFETQNLSIVTNDEFCQASYGHDGCEQIELDRCINQEFCTGSQVAQS